MSKQNYIDWEQVLASSIVLEASCQSGQREHD